MGAGIHYPVPLHLQEAYRSLGYKVGDFPITEKLATEIISSPMYPGLGLEEQTFIVERVVEHIRQAGAIGSLVGSGEKEPAA